MCVWESSFLGASPRQSSPVGGWGGSAALIPSLPPPSPCVLMAREPSARPHRDQLSGKAKPWDVPQARRPVTLDNPGQSLAFLQSQFITCRQKYTLFLYSIHGACSVLKHQNCIGLHDPNGMDPTIIAVTVTAASTDAA